jgi:hypothetical protein
MDHNHLLPAGTKRQPSLIVIIGITGVVAPIEIPAGHIGRGKVYINAGKQQTAILAVLASDTRREIWNRSLIPPSDPSLPLNRGFPDPRRKKNVAAAVQTRYYSTIITRDDDERLLTARPPLGSSLRIRGLMTSRLITGTRIS